MANLFTETTGGYYRSADAGRYAHQPEDPDRLVEFFVGDLQSVAEMEYADNRARHLQRMFNRFDHVRHNAKTGYVQKFMRGTILPMLIFRTLNQRGTRWYYYLDRMIHIALSTADTEAEFMGWMESWFKCRRNSEKKYVKSHGRHPVPEERVAQITAKVLYEFALPIHGQEVAETHEGMYMLTGSLDAALPPSVSAMGVKQAIQKWVDAESHYYIGGFEIPKEHWVAEIAQQCMSRGLGPMQRGKFFQDHQAVVRLIDRNAAISKANFDEQKARQAKTVRVATFAELNQ